ncbi:hypothetical protein HanPSC8_Chr10g0422541 [Helianthus annuus]|nr:hypothetical protein HanPSC8_Chr10g0422541 [Helianthus annuus]
MTLVVVVPKFSVHLFGGHPGPAVGIKDRWSKSLTGKFQRFQLRVFGSSYVSVWSGGRRQDPAVLAIVRRVCR